MTDQSWNTAANYNGDSLLPLGGRSTIAPTMPDNLLFLLNNASMLVLGIAAVGAMARWRSLSVRLRLMAIAMTTMLGFGLLTMAFWLTGTPNLPILHVYTVVEFILLGSFYALLATSKAQQRIVVGLMTVGLLLIVLNSVLLQPFDTFNSNARTLESLLLASFAVQRMFQVSGNHLNQTTEQKALFWINAGVLLYFSASLIVFLFSDYTSQLSIEMSRNIWSIHALFNLLFSCLLAVGIFKLWKPTTTSSD